MARGRSIFFYIFLFLSTLSVAVQAIEAEGYRGKVSHQDDERRKAHKQFLGELAEEVPEPEYEEKKQAEGQQYVDEALQILNSIRPPSASKRKESQYLNTFLYYLQKALDIAFVANVPTQEEPVDGQPRGQAPMSKQLSEAVGLLQKGVSKANPDALYLMADMFFYGNWSHPRNSATAFGFYHQLAQLTGNSTAQNMVAFMYATGYGGHVHKDQAKALLYHTFAALGGNTRSEMTLAFRYHAGISMPRNCDEAAFYYKRVADKAMKYFLSGPPGGMHLPRHNHKIADENGGVYGEGASFSSAGPNKRRAHDHSATTSIDDIIEYLLLLSNKGDLSATYQLAKLYYEGPKGLQRDLKKARDMFFQLAKKMWGKDGKEVKDPSDVAMEAGAKAAGYLGRMYLRGEALPQDLAIARRWFSRGLKYADVISQHGMAYLYEHGLAGVDKNIEKATKLYKAAAEDDYGPSQVAIGKIFYNRGEYSYANKWFELATRHGNVEAYYWLAEINNQGNGRERSCGMATLYYKHVSERVEALQAPLEWAHRAHKNNNRESALVGFMMAAEQGYESGQANVAWLLDEQKSRFPLAWWRVKRNDPKEQELALMYWTRSAKQQNIDSFVKMGDYYLEGIGSEADNEKAASCYLAASEFQQSAQALWNLGWMHENGVGVEQDYHLAKRYYDQALESNAEAYLPVTLSLLMLRGRSFWNTVTGGSINAIGSDPEPKKEITVREWLKKWFAPEEKQYTHNKPSMGEETEKEDAKLPDLGGNDLYDDDFEDDALENMIILGIMMVVAVLVWLRNQRQQQQRERQLRELQQRAGQAGQAGQALHGAQQGVPGAVPPGAGAGAGAGAAGFGLGNNPWMQAPGIP